jgi:hypothetical protein
MQMTTASETQIKTATTDKQRDSALPSRKPSRKSIFALSVFALGLNATAAVYTLSPSDFALPNVGSLAELLPYERAPAPIPEAVAAALKDIRSGQQQQADVLRDIQSAQQQQADALKDIQSTQRQHAAALKENGSSLQQNTALLQQDSTTFSSLRQGITDEQVGVKKISVQLSTLIAKVDSLQNAKTPEITASIPKGRARSRLSGAAYKRVATRQPKPVGPLSVVGAPLTIVPAQGLEPVHKDQKAD